MYKPLENKSEKEQYSCWNQLKDQNTVPVNKFIYNIDVDYTTPFKYAVVTETEIPIYRCESNAKEMNLGNFKNASCCKFRGDGAMVLVGTKTGQILMISPKFSGKILHSIPAHTKEITKIEYLHKLNPIQIYSASISEDGTLQIWDLTEKTLLHKFDHSLEPLRALAVTEANPDLVATGSMDGNIRVYNIEKSKSPILVLNTFMSVNCLLFPIQSNYDFILSAGDSSLALWRVSHQDVDATNKPLPLQSTTPHHMQITDMCVADCPDTKARIIFTAGLDGMIKVLHLSDFQEVHKYEYPSGLMAIRVLPDCKHLVVAGNNNADNTNSFIYTRKMMPSEDEVARIQDLTAAQAVENKIHALMDRLCVPNESLTVFEHQKTPKSTVYENFLRKHHHRGLINHMANDRSLENKPELFKKLIRELDNLGALKRSLAAQPDIKIRCILRLVRKFVKDPNYTVVSLKVISLINELYPVSVLERMREYINLKHTMAKIVKKFRNYEQIVHDLTVVLNSVNTKTKRVTNCAINK